MTASAETITHQRRAFRFTSYGENDMAAALSLVFPRGSITALSHDETGMTLTDSRTVIPSRTTADDPWQPLQHGEGSEVAPHVMGWLYQLSHEQKLAMCMETLTDPIKGIPDLIGWRMTLFHEELGGELCSCLKIVPAWYS